MSQVAAVMVAFKRAPERCLLQYFKGLILIKTL
jgi:hypothetical protein